MTKPPRIPGASSQTSSTKGEGNSKKSSSRSSRSRSIPGSSQPSQSTSTLATKRSNSDSPSSKANNDNGRRELQKRIRSVLFHPLGLALLLAFHDNARINEGLPSWLFYFQKSKGDTTYDNVLTESVEEWRKNPKAMREEVLTKLITGKINETSDAVLATHQVQVMDKDNTSPGKVDIMVGTQKDVAPSLVIEVGMDASNWFGKLDQALMYLERMCLQKNAKQKCGFQKPLLLAIVTMDKGGQGDKVDFQIGVFLCSRKHLNCKTLKDDFRMSLLWQSRTKSLNEASKLFGRTLIISQLFGNCRNCFKIGVKKYEYLSSNCCKIQCKEEGKLVNKVFRIYDHRFRESTRSATVYRAWEPVSHDTVGLLNWDAGVAPNLDSAKDVPNLDSTKGSQEATWMNGFCKKPPHESLQLISTPYREGRHFATFPTDFVPIIDQLQKLHDAGFVHGDIRAYNMVFGKRVNERTPPEGWLIDFDFGGEAGKVFYPSGYNRNLADGARLGKPGQPIEKWHDWWALGDIIFHKHSLSAPLRSTFPLGSVEYETQQDTRECVDILTSKWNNRKTIKDLEKKDIQELKAFLQKAEDVKWSVRLHGGFEADLEEVRLKEETCPKATGSPPKIAV